MNVAVCVPYRNSGPERERNWNYTCAWWHQIGWPIFEGDDTGEEKFAVGRSRNLAAEAAGDWDVAVFTDTDMVPGTTAQAKEAVKTAVRGGYTVIYSELRYIDDATTNAVCVNHLPLAEAVPYHAVGLTWISSFAISRRLWDDVGGFDNRFRGYGGEDLAFYFAASTLGGSARVQGPLYHLHHPDDRDTNAVDGNWTLVNAYSGAVGDKEAMRAVLADKT